jgi:hypothetical protein
VALDRLCSDGFGHDGRKGTTGPTGPSWAERAWQSNFGKRNKKKIETGWAARGFWAKIRSGCLRKRKFVFDFLIQGNGIRVKRFKYFQTEFELDSK